MINELQVAMRIADGTLPSPQQFGASWYWAIRMSGTGAAWRESENEFVWREPDIWLTPEMCDRAGSLPILIDHPASGTLNSPEFAARCVGMTTYAYVRGDELWAIARVLDAGANEILAAGAYEDTSPAVTFAPGTGARIEIDGKALLIEPAPMLIDHIAFCARGIWSRDSAPEGVETTKLGRGDCIVLLDSDKLARIGATIASNRAESLSTPSASEYKKLVKDRDAAKAALVALQRRAEESGYAGLNFRNVEAEYSRASKALAAAQMKMTEK